MAISASTLTQSTSATNASSYATASITATAGRPILFFVASQEATTSTTGNTPTLTGASLTITTVAAQTYHTAAARKLSILVATPTANSTGAITIDFAGQTQLACSWAVVEFPNLSLSQPTVQIVQDATFNATTSYSMTLSAFSSTLNGTLGAFFSENPDANMTAGSGFDELAEQQSDSVRLFVEFNASNDTSVDVALAASRRVGGIVLELRHHRYSASFSLIE